MEVDNENINFTKHIWRRLAKFAIKGIDRQASFRVNMVGDVVKGLEITVNAVFWSIEGHEIHIGMVKKDVDGPLAAAIEACGVGDESNAAISEELEVLLLGDIDA